MNSIFKQPQGGDPSSGGYSGKSAKQPTSLTRPDVGEAARAIEKAKAQAKLDADEAKRWLDACCICGC